MLVFSNNAETTLATAISSSLEDGSIVALDDGSANGFSTPQFFGGGRRTQLATLTHASNPGAYEVVEISARDGFTFTVTRGVEEYRWDWPIGTKMSARVTAKTLNSFPQVMPTPSFQKALVLDSESCVVDFPNSGDTGDESPVDCSAGNSFVFAGRSTLGRTVQISRYPVLQVEQLGIRDAYRGDAQDLNMSYPSVGGTFHLDLGDPIAWSAETTYQRGSVVVPAVANGFQYWMEAPALGREFQSGSTEPAFAAGVVEESNSESGALPALWRSTAMPIEFTQNLGYQLVVTEVGFIASKVTSASVPAISIGTEANPTRFASNVSLSQITGGSGVHRIPIAVGGDLVDELVYKVDTPAAGGQFLGRFYWRGFFVELQGG